MNYTFTPYVIPIFFSAALSAGVAIYAFRKRQQLGALTFSLLMTAVAIWSLSYALVILGTDLPTKVFWNKAKYLGVSFLPSFWLMFALRYTGRGHLLTRRNITLLLIPGTLALLVVLTNDWHHLWWTEIWLDDMGPFLALASHHGPAYWVHAIVGYVYLLTGFVLYLMTFWHASRLYRWQSSLLVISALIPLTANILGLIHLSPLPGNLDPFAFALSGLLMAYSIFRHRLLDITPVARRVVVDNMPDGVIVVDTTGRIVDLNSAARTMGDLGSSEAIGKRLSKAFHQPDLVGGLEATLREGAQRPVEKEVSFTSQQGERVLHVSVSPLTGWQDSALGHLIVLRDVTQRVRDEEQLAHLYREAQEANRLKSEFLATVSHELRTPMNCIIGYTHLVLDRAFGELTPEQEMRLQTVARNARHLLNLINDTLDFSKIETDKMGLSLTAVSLKEVILEAFQTAKPWVQEKGLTLELKLEDELPLARADKERTRQVLLNLLSNAVKFTKKGGITVAAGAVHGGMVQFSVADTGIGISEKDQPIIFDAFRQVDGSYAREYGGAGLGLPLAKRLVEMMGGRITVRSEVGMGSTFTVTLAQVAGNSMHTRPLS
jgi:PAS domain S-box-containing protein